MQKNVISLGNCAAKTRHVFVLGRRHKGVDNAARASIPTQRSPPIDECVRCAAWIKPPALHTKATFSYYRWRYGRKLSTWMNTDPTQDRTFARSQNYGQYGQHTSPEAPFFVATQHKIFEVPPITYDVCFDPIVSLSHRQIRCVVAERLRSRRRKTK